MVDVTIWLCVTTRENWEVIQREGVWGISSSPRLKKSVEILKIGDRIIVYVKQEKRNHDFIGPLVGGLCEVLSEPFKSDRKIFAGPSAEKFSLRVKVKTLMQARKPLDFKKLVPQLSFIENKKNWSRYMQRSMIVLPEKDSECIVSELKRNA